MSIVSYANFTSDRQKSAEAYVLKSIDNDKTREASAKQALNDVFLDRGKACLTTTVDGKANIQIKHASAGAKGKDNSVTVFYYVEKNAKQEITMVYLLALGSHKSDSTYAIHKQFGQTEFPFKRGTVVNVDGSKV
ncbi:hypothetical protein [Streptomyces sp. NPDC006879]|uniref:hypothetical protein n=1 Tax=Streptomyces sp. NPDC006879 TaxID=3364767 RepID=UPI0036986C38